jgi:hypothetical protein
MDEETKSMKKKIAFNIVQADTHPHMMDRGTFGAGSIDLSQVICVIVDGAEAYVDAGAMHGRSGVEKRIRFSPDKSTVENGRPVWIVWVAVDRNAEGAAYYAGVTASPMLIDTEARRGWKILPQHVQQLEFALKRRFDLDELADGERTALRTLLVNLDADKWERSDERLKTLLA